MIIKMKMFSTRDRMIKIDKLIHETRFKIRSRSVSGWVEWVARCNLSYLFHDVYIPGNTVP